MYLIIDVASMPKKTEAEETRDLIKQVEEEEALRKNYEVSWQADIEARLAKLKGDEINVLIDAHNKKLII